jgi:hypothetical protein
MSDVYTHSDGTTDRPLESRGLFRPLEVTNLDNLLAFKLGDSDPRRERNPGQQILQGFMSLRNKRDATILEYAKDWGPLGVCAQGAPAHAMVVWTDQGIDTGKACEGLRAVPGYMRKRPQSSRASRVSIAQEPSAVFPLDSLDRSAACGPSQPPAGYDWAEPLYVWRAYIDAARDTNRMIGKLYGALHDLLAGGQAVERLGSQLGFAIHNGEPLTISDRFSQLQDRLDWWIKAGQVRPGLSLTTGNNLTQKLVGSALLGGVAMQLLLLASGSKGLATCTNCLSPYSPTRTPRIDQNNYCDSKECQRAGKRERKARSRAKSNAPHKQTES